MQRLYKAGKKVPKSLFKTSIMRPFTVDKNITINGIIEIFKENKKYLN